MKIIFPEGKVEFAKINRAFKIYTDIVNRFCETGPETGVAADCVISISNDFEKMTDSFSQLAHYADHIGENNAALVTAYCFIVGSDILVFFAFADRNGKNYGEEHAVNRVIAYCRCVTEKVIRGE